MKTCDNCGEVLSGAPHRRRYCSDRCKHRAARRRSREQRVVPVEAQNRIRELRGRVEDLTGELKGYQKRLQAQQERRAQRDQNIQRLKYQQDRTHKDAEETKTRVASQLGAERKKSAALRAQLAAAQEDLATVRKQLAGVRRDFSQIDEHADQDDAFQQEALETVRVLSETVITIADERNQLAEQLTEANQILDETNELVVDYRLFASVVLWYEETYRVRPSQDVTHALNRYNQRAVNAQRRLDDKQQPTGTGR